MVASDPIDGLSGLDFCYLTTVGRRTGRPHTIEIWFGSRDRTVYLLSGSDRSDWVLNLIAEPSVTLRLGGETFPATAAIVEDRDEHAMARRLLAGKYQNWSEPQPLSEWAATATVVAIEVPETSP